MLVSDQLGFNVVLLADVLAGASGKNGYIILVIQGFAAFMYIFDTSITEAETVRNFVARAALRQRVLIGRIDSLPVIRMHGGDERLIRPTEIGWIDLEDTKGFVGPFQFAGSEIQRPASGLG